MGIWNILPKILIGYERKDHKFDSSRLPEGDVKFLNKKQDELIKNENGRLVYYKKLKNGKWIGRSIPVKERKS